MCQDDILNFLAIWDSYVGIGYVGIDIIYKNLSINRSAISTNLKRLRNQKAIEFIKVKNVYKYRLKR